MKIILFFNLFISTYYFSQNNNDIEWNKYENEFYSINYPKEWKSKGSEYAFLTGESIKFIEAGWILIISDFNNKERIDFFFEDSFNDYKTTKREIIVDGVKGNHFTHKKENEFIEILILKSESKWFKFQNNEIKDDNFKEFYTSFKLKK